jgi:hypothetical protein
MGHDLELQGVVNMVVATALAPRRRSKEEEKEVYRSAKVIHAIVAGEDHRPTATAALPPPPTKLPPPFLSNVEAKMKPTSAWFHTEREIEKLFEIVP